MSILLIASLRIHLAACECSIACRLFYFFASSIKISINSFETFQVPVFVFQLYTGNHSNLPRIYRKAASYGCYFQDPSTKDSGDNDRWNMMLISAFDHVLLCILAKLCKCGVPSQFDYHGENRLEILRQELVKVTISLTSTQFHESFREVENIGQNVTENFGNNDSQMAVAMFVIVEIHSLKGAKGASIHKWLWLWL